MKTLHTQLNTANTCAYGANLKFGRALAITAWLTVLGALLVCLPRLFGQQVSSANAPGPAAVTERKSPSSPANRSALVESYGKLPLSFEANEGQADKSIKFLSRGDGYSVLLTDSAAVLALTKPDSAQAPSGSLARKPDPLLPSNKPRKTDFIRMELVGAAAPGQRSKYIQASAEARLEGMDKLPGNANYFLGNDPAKWHTNVSTYAKVRYTEAYPGIDLLFYGNQRQLEYDFVVAPQADPNSIRLHFAGARKLTLTPAGDLAIQAKNGQIAFHKPVIYQQRDGERRPIEGSFTLLARNTVGFSLGSYDHTHPLVIDPVLGYSTYLGGTGGDDGQAIAVDSAGNAYITGSTSSSDFPVTAGALQTTFKGNSFNAFVTKLNPDGSALVYSTYLGGSGQNLGSAIAVDGSGNAYIAGNTSSSDFPVTAGAFQATKKATITGFVAKLDPTGSALIFSTFLGGSAGDYPQSLALDSSGNTYVAGGTDSSDFPVTAGAFQTTNKVVAAHNYGNETGFVTELSATGTSLIYSTFLGGSNYDNANGIAVDGSGNAYIAGNTSSSDFPVTAGAFQTVMRNQDSAFVTKLNPSGSALAYSTYLGGSGLVDNATAIAIDASGDAFIAGQTDSSDFPVTIGAFQTTNKTVASGSNGTAFITSLNPTGTSLNYSTFLGGSFFEGANAIAVDGSGSAYVAGFTESSDFPVTSGAIQTIKKSAEGFSTSFLTRLNQSGTALLYSTYFGGSSNDYSFGIAIDGSSDAYVTGHTSSVDFPVSSGAFQATQKGKPGSTSAFATKLDLASTNPVTATTTTLTSSANPQTSGQPVTFTAVVAGTGTGKVPTGSVVFSADGAAAATVALNSAGEAAYSTSTLAAGAHTIAANYGGDSNFAPSSGNLTETIDLPQATAPSCSPAVGSYTTSVSVTLADSTPGAAIYYTANGTTPTAASTAYNSPITVSATETIEAIAVVAGYTNSAVASCAYTIMPPAATPTFSPAGGTYTSAQMVTIGDTTAGATIYYTTNGTVPTTSSTQYTGPIAVSSSETVEAIAAASGDTNSAVVSAAYTINIVNPTAATPTFSPAAGTYTAAQTVTISDGTSGAIVYYTTNGTTPTTSSTVYSGPITVSSTETIEAIAGGGSLTSSAIATAAYTINIATQAAATPTFSPAAGTYTSAQTVTIASTTPGATIYYTTNGTTPTTSSTLYAGPVTVSASETLQAIAMATGDTNSAVATAAYTINLPAPSFTVSVTPAALTVTGGQSGTETVSVTPQNGFNAAVTFACSGLPVGASCSFAPASVTPSGGTAASTTLTVSAATASAALRRNPIPLFPGTTLAVALCFLGWKKRRGLQLLLLLTIGFAGLSLLSGCGGSSSNSTSGGTGSQPITQTVTVTATSGTIQNTATFSLTVN